MASAKNDDGSSKIMIFLMGTLIWIGVSIRQAIADARYRLLPWGPTMGAGIVALLVGWHQHALGTGAVWWVGHVGASLGLVTIGMILWFVGALGLGDVAVFGVLGIAFGLVGAVTIIALSYFVMALIVGIRMLRRQSTDNLPLGIPLWLGSIPVWILVMGVAPHIGGIL